MRQVELVIENQLKSDVPLVDSAARYVTQNGGKRIRPAIFILAAKLAGQVSERIPRLAAALELVHVASLLHDDVVDDGQVRRGKPSAKIKWGNQVSVLLGDFLWCKASELFIENGTEHFWSVISKAITAITEGQILETTRLNDITVNEKEYQQVIEGKTAALFGVCGQGAAIIQGLSEKFEMALKQYGFNLGVAFQLTDDVLDYTSDGNILGKNTGSDFREGKLTLPVIIALRKCNISETQKIKEGLITGTLSKEQFDEVIEIVKRHEGISQTICIANEYIKKAKENLSIFKPSIEHNALTSLADYVLERLCGPRA